MHILEGFCMYTLCFRANSELHKRPVPTLSCFTTRDTVTSRESVCALTVPASPNQVPGCPLSLAQPSHPLVSPVWVNLPERVGLGAGTINQSRICPRLFHRYTLTPPLPSLPPSSPRFERPLNHFTHLLKWLFIGGHLAKVECVCRCVSV